VIFCFEKRRPKQKYCSSPKSNILDSLHFCPPQNILGWLCHLPYSLRSGAVGWNVPSTHSLKWERHLPTFCDSADLAPNFRPTCCLFCEVLNTNSLRYTNRSKTKLFSYNIFPCTFLSHGQWSHVFHRIVAIDFDLKFVLYRLAPVKTTFSRPAANRHFRFHILLKPGISKTPFITNTETRYI